MMTDDFKKEDNVGEIQFHPPLYTQRYVLAARTLTDHKVESVVDFGCSECGFFKLLPTACCVERAALVDIDRALLLAKKQQIQPELHHFLQRRDRPLHVSLYQGSAADLDSRIHGFEAATLIEVIEHLHEDVLDQVTDNVFGSLQPRLCFVTTPNSEFNVLFKNEDPLQFRHWDHKFEWTRQQFQTWSDEVCKKFGYKVEYTGVGYVTSDPESARLGPCSQVAIFTKTEGASSGDLENENSVVHKPGGKGQESQPYELIAESHFPYVKERLSEEERLDQEVAFCVRDVCHYQSSEVAFGDAVCVSVSHIAQYKGVKVLADLEAVRKSLERQRFTLTPTKNHILIAEEDSSSDDEEQVEDDKGDEQEGEKSYHGSNFLGGSHCKTDRNCDSWREDEQVAESVCGSKGFCDAENRSCDSDKGQGGDSLQGENWQSEIT